MLGRRFCPRIKDVKHQYIYRIDAAMDYGQLAHIVGWADRTIDPQTVVDHWDKIGQLVDGQHRKPESYQRDPHDLLQVS
jgi:TnpA family transposase